MKKITVSLIILTIVGVGFLSGCINEKTTENGQTETKTFSDNFVGRWTVDGYNGIIFYPNQTLSYYGEPGTWLLNDSKLEIEITIWNWSASVDFNFSDNYNKLNLTGLSSSIWTGEPKTISYTKQDTMQEETTIYGPSDDDSWRDEIPDNLGYVNEDFRFGINIPDGWSLPFYGGITSNMVTFCNNPHAILPILTVTQTPFYLNDTITLKDVVEQWMNIYPNATKTECTIGSLDGYEIRYPSYEFLDYYVIRKDVLVGAYEKVFIISYQVAEDDYDDYLHIVDESIDSFMIFEGKTSFDWLNKMVGIWHTPPMEDILTFTFSFTDVKIGFEGDYETEKQNFELKEGKLVFTWDDGSGSEYSEENDFFFSNNYHTLTLISDFLGKTILIKQT
ncbi:MAG: hypothetical protein QHH19_03655 [Candidatus Thermoplasmatota archaeon]|jgi:hypothetical protein|nr:hypothetical protein [Candidatus Thermoplasmatota archaeon]